MKTKSEMILIQNPKVGLILYDFPKIYSLKFEKGTLKEFKYEMQNENRKMREGEVIIPISDETKEVLRKEINKIWDKRLNDNRFINIIEKRILISLHLQGMMGKCGNLNKVKRKEMLDRLIRRGILNENCKVTPFGLELIDEN